MPPYRAKLSRQIGPVLAVQPDRKKGGEVPAGVAVRGAGSMPLCVSSAGATDLGRRRERNEDRFAIAAHQRLYLVADGMGGHRCGATASRLATETIVEFFGRSALPEFAWPLHPDPRLSLLENRLLAALRAE